MPRAILTASRMLSLPHLFFLSLFAVLCCLIWASSTAAQVTLLVPSQPSIEAPAGRDKADKAEKDAPQAKNKEEQKKNAPEQKKTVSPDKAAGADQAPPQPGKAAQAEKQNGGESTDKAQPPAPEPPTPDADAKAQGEAPAPTIAEEVDVLISMMRPFQHEGLPVDMPQLFAVLRYGDDTPIKDSVMQPERRDLLGDVEEIRYLDQKAWGANVALSHPGLYQFVIESRPSWDAARARFVQHYVKTTLPVYGVGHGWEVPVGQRFEIQPLTRPFGLTAPALFSGRVLFNGKALGNAQVRMTRINTDRQSAPTPWHEALAARSDEEGRFAFVLNQPGWWCCAATTPGDPLKGPDGQPKPLELGALFWLYVDGAATEIRKH